MTEKKTNGQLKLITSKIDNETQTDHSKRSKAPLSRNIATSEASTSTEMKQNSEVNDKFRVKQNCNRSSKLCSGIYIEGMIEGQKVLYSVDTGASISLLSQQIYDNISKENRPILEPPVQCQTADGRELPCSGKAYFTIQLGNLEICTQLTVSTITVRSEEKMLFHGVSIPPIVKNNNNSIRGVKTVDHNRDPAIVLHEFRENTRPRHEKKRTSPGFWTKLINFFMTFTLLITGFGIATPFHKHTNKSTKFVKSEKCDSSWTGGQPSENTIHSSKFSRYFQNFILTYWITQIMQWCAKGQTKGSTEQQTHEVTNTLHPTLIKKQKSLCDTKSCVNSYQVGSYVWFLTKHRQCGRNPKLCTP